MIVEYEPRHALKYKTSLNCDTNHIAEFPE